jgi:hypothetical protein
LGHWGQWSEMCLAPTSDLELVGRVEASADDWDTADRRQHLAVKPISGFARCVGSYPADLTQSNARESRRYRTAMADSFSGGIGLIRARAPTAVVYKSPVVGAARSVGLEMRPAPDCSWPRSDPAFLIGLMFCTGSDAPCTDAPGGAC